MVNKEINYDEWFTVDFKQLNDEIIFKKFMCKDEISDSIKVVLKKYHTSIKQKYETKNDVHYRWCQYLFYGKANYESLEYANLNLLIDIGKQLILDNIVDNLKICFKWNNQTENDHINNTFILRRKNNKVFIARQKVKVVQYGIDLSEEIKKV